MSLRGIWLGALASVLLIGEVDGAPFAKTFSFVQPNGTEIKLWGEGDEFYAVFETLDGYTVVFNPSSGAYEYAQRSASADALVPSGVPVGGAVALRAGVAKHLRMDRSAINAQVQKNYAEWDQRMQLTERWTAMKEARRHAGIRPALGGLGSPITGTRIGLCLLVDFEDDPATVPASQFDDFCNGTGYTGYGNNGSVKEYYQYNSGGALTYLNIVIPFVRIPNSVHPKRYYNDWNRSCWEQSQLLVKDAVAILKSLPNYQSEILPLFNSLSVDENSTVIALNVFFAGGNSGVWARGLWPCASALFQPLELSPGGKKILSFQITDIGSTLELGVFCHECGHMLCGFPDLYDYDYDSRGGAGTFCLMGWGGWGSNPTQICAYLKYIAGWSRVTEINASSRVSASVTSSPGPEFNHFYRYQKPGTPTEYFLVENRQESDRDAEIFGSGIAIWHIDELGDHNNQSLAPNTVHANYEVTLVQADSQWDLERNLNIGDSFDLYYSGNGAGAYSGEFSDSSSPSAAWWDGSASGVMFRNFSRLAATMTFDINPTFACSINRVSNADVEVRFPIAAGQTTVLEGANSLESPIRWTPLFIDNGTETGGAIFHDTANQPARYYRAYRH